jgi:hypothetical protein
MQLSLLLISLVNCVVVQQPPSLETFDHHESLILPSKQTIELFWTIKHSQIKFGVSSETSYSSDGWLAIGTSDAGGMKGANYFIFKNNFLEERFSETYEQPSIKANTATQLLSFNSTEQGKFFTFSTPLCNGLTTKNPIWIIFAYGDNEFQQHLPSNRGQQLIDLSGSYFITETNPTERTQTLDIISPPVQMVAEKTAYCYSYHDISTQLDEKYHIIAQNAELGTPLVHHMIGYVCQSKQDLPVPGKVICNYFKENGTEIRNSEQPCAGEISEVNFIWGPGGKGIFYPSNVGKPIGDANHRYFILETHYNNPELLTDVVDPGSGFKLTITKQLRKFDVGILTLGLDILNWSVPGLGTPSISGECGSKCTSKPDLIPSSGLNVLSMALHMHMHGKSMITRHIRYIFS